MGTGFEKLGSLKQAVSPETLELVKSLRYTAGRLSDEVESVYQAISEEDQENLAELFAEFNIGYEALLAKLLDLTAGEYDSGIEDTRPAEAQQLAATLQRVKEKIITDLTARAGLNVGFYRAGANTQDALPLLTHNGELSEQIPATASQPGDESPVKASSEQGPQTNSPEVIQQHLDELHRYAQTAADIYLDLESVREALPPDDLIHLSEWLDSAQKIDANVKLLTTDIDVTLGNQSLAVTLVMVKDAVKDLQALKERIDRKISEMGYVEQSIDDTDLGLPTAVETLPKTDTLTKLSEDFRTLKRFVGPRGTFFSLDECLKRTRDAFLNELGVSTIPAVLPLEFARSRRNITAINRRIEEITQSKLPIRIKRSKIAAEEERITAEYQQLGGIVAFQLEQSTKNLNTHENQSPREAVSDAYEDDFREEIKQLKSHYDFLCEKILPLRDEYADKILLRIEVALSRAENVTDSDPHVLQRKRAQYIKDIKKNFARLQGAEFFSDAAQGPVTDEMNISQSSPRAVETESIEPSYADLVKDSPKIYDPNTIKSSQRFVLPETDEPTYIDLVKDEPQFRVAAQEPEPELSNTPPAGPKQNLHETIEYQGIRDEWRTASREYRNAATAYEQAYDQYLRSKGVGRKLAEKFQTLRGKEVTLPPVLQRLQGEYRSAKRQYAESLAAALAARSGVYDGNENFSLNERRTKIAFGEKFVSRPRMQLNAIKAGALKDEAARSRLRRVMQFMGNHRTATRVVGLGIATSVGALTGGALGAGISAGRWALGVFGGAVVAKKVSQSMHVSVERAQARHALVESSAQNEFSLEKLDAIDREVDAAAFEVEKMKAQQTVYTIGSAALFAGSTAYAASFIPRGMPEFPMQESAPARPEVTPEAVEGFNGIPFARVPRLEVSDLRTPNGVPLPAQLLVDITLVAEHGDGLPTQILEIATVRGEMLAAVKQYLSERPNIPKEQLEALVFSRLESKFGTEEWWQKANVKEMHIGEIAVLESPVPSQTELSSGLHFQVDEVIAQGAMGNFRIQDINLIGKGKSVEIPDAEAVQIFDTIKLNAEKIIAQNTQGLTKLDLERHLFARLTEQYGNTAWWKEAAMEKVSVGTFNFIGGEPAADVKPIASVRPERVVPQASSPVDTSREASQTPVATEAVVEERRPIRPTTGPLPVTALEASGDTPTRVPIENRVVERINPQEPPTRPSARSERVAQLLEQRGITEAAVDRRVDKWVRSIERSNALLTERGAFASPYEVLGKMTVDEVNRLRTLVKADPNSLRDFAQAHDLSVVAVRKWFNQIDVITNKAAIPKTAPTFSDWFRQHVATDMLRAEESSRRATITWTRR